MNDDLSFGELVQKLRRDKEWTVKDFIARLDVVKLSPAYITRVELHGEIPSPDLILKMANALGYDENKLLTCAKTHKIKKFGESLEKKYQQAFGLYRKEKRKP